MTKFATLLAAIPILALLIDFLLSRSLVGSRYRWFVAPGVIIHELAHAGACFITGAKIHNMALFDKKGGRVEHYKPKLPVIGQILISTAPIIVGIIALYFLSRQIGFKQINIASMNFSYDSIFNHIIGLIRGIDLESKKSLIIIYLMFSIAMTMNPSTQDLMNISFTLIFLGAVIYSLYRFTHIRPNLSILMPEAAALVLSTVVVLLILCFVFSIVVFIISKTIKPA